MMGVWKASLAGVAAVGLHVAGFALVPVGGGAQASGDAGDAPITLAASDPGVTAMVANWDTAPTVADAPARPVLRDIASAMAVPTADTAPILPNAMAPLQPIMSEQAPFVWDAAAPLPAVRPKARPVQAAIPDPTAMPAPATRLKPAGSGTAGQVAAGSGGGTQAGSGGQASAGTLSGTAKANLQAEWGASIRARIERKKRYPAGTTATGAVKLRLKVGADGRLQTLSILQSSGDTALDAAAVKAVKTAGRFAKAPNGVTGAASFTLTISFSR